MITYLLFGVYGFNFVRFIPQADGRGINVTFQQEYEYKPKVHVAATGIEPEKPLDGDWPGWRFSTYEITKTGFKAGVRADDMYENSKYKAAWIACGHHKI